MLCSGDASHAPREFDGVGDLLDLANLFPHLDVCDILKIRDRCAFPGAGNRDLK